MVWPIAFAKSARASPTLLYQDGGLLWNAHCSTLPPSPFASIARTMCGLIQSTRVSVPVTATCLDMSKTADGEWWACSVPTVRSVRTTQPAAETLSFTSSSWIELGGNITRAALLVSAHAGAGGASGAGEA